MIDDVFELLQNQHNIALEDLTEYDHDAMDELISAAYGSDVAVDSGVSKLVLLIKDESHVMKIPYMKRFDEDMYDQAYADYTEADDRGEEVGRAPVIEDFCFPFQSARIDIIDTSNNWDYCALECAIYEEAHNRGLAQYFAEEVFFGEIGDHPVYIQKRVTPFDSYSSTTTHNFYETTSRCNKLNVRCINSVWTEDFMNFYGEQEYVKLVHFLDELKIYDLHAGNLGYLDGAPILLDYSDFREFD